MVVEKGKYRYEESFYSGRNCLLVDGVECKRVDRNHHITKDGKEIIINGSYFTGIVLIDGENQIVLVESIRWYEYLLSMLFVGIVVYAVLNPQFKNGLIGGLISGVAGIINLVLIRQFKNIIIKILVTIGVGLVAFGLLYLIIFFSTH